MLKKIDNLLAAFGNKKTDESLDAAFFEGDIATNIEGTKIAASQHGQIFVGIQELQGYTFLEVISISRTNVKSKKGATMRFSNTKDAFTLVSDTQEIESDFFKAVNCYITQISFNITAKEIARIKKKDFEEIHLEYKKKVLTFKKSPMKKLILACTCIVALMITSSCKEEKSMTPSPQKMEKTTIDTSLVKVPENWINDRVSKANKKLNASPAGTIVWKAMEAHSGLANWYSKGAIAFHFDYKPLDGSTQRNTYQTVDMWRNTARHQHYDDRTQEFGWDGSQAWTKTTDSTAFAYNIRFWALTPYYFLAQPFVLDGEGVILEQLEDKNYKEKMYDVIKVSFAPGTGDAPDDYYVLYFGKEDHKLGIIRYIVSYPGYFEKGKHLPEKFMELQGHTTVDGITLSTGYHTHWLLEDETPGEHITTITVDNISFKPETKKEYLEVPEGATIIEGLK